MYLNNCFSVFRYSIPWKCTIKFFMVILPGAPQGSGAPRHLTPWHPSVTSLALCLRTNHTHRRLTEGSVGKRCMLTPGVSPLFVQDFLFGPPATQNTLQCRLCLGFFDVLVLSSIFNQGHPSACPALYVTGS